MAASGEAGGSGPASRKKATVEFPPDVRLKGAEACHISRAMAKDNAKRLAPMVETRDDEGKVRYEPHPLCGTNVGCNRCCPSVCHRKDTDSGELTQYGLGVMLFFMFVKFMAYLFIVMSVVMLPALLIFYAASVELDDARAKAGEEPRADTLTDALARFSPASLGELAGQCRDGYETASGAGASNPLEDLTSSRRRVLTEVVSWDRVLQEEEVGIPGVVELICPAGTTIASVETYYGTPLGECGCPGEQAPDSDGACPASRTVAGCDPSDGYCYHSANRVLTTPDGTEISTGACCSSSLTSDAAADFSDLDIKEDKACALESSQRIAEMRCLRRDSCRLSANRYALQPWVSDPDGDVNRECSPTEERLGTIWRNAASLEDKETLLSNNGLDTSIAEDDTKWTPCATFLATPLSLTYVTEVELSSGDTTTDEDEVVEAVADALVHVVGNLTADCDDHRGSSSLRLIAVAQCLDLTIDAYGLVTIAKTDVVSVLVAFDLLLCLIFLVGVTALARRQKEEDKETSFATPSDYTVRVENVPPHDSLSSLKHALKEGIERYLSSTEPMFKHLPHGVKIADINFGLDSVDVTEAMVRQGKAATKLQAAASELAIRGITWGEIKASDEYKEYKETGGGFLVRCCKGKLLGCCGTDTLRLAHRIETLKDRLKKAHEEVEIGRKEADELARAIHAFVTFEEEEGVFRARAEYPDSNCYSLCCMPREAQIVTKTSDGKSHRTSIQVSRADEPSDIVWENVRYERGCMPATWRYFIGFLFILLLLAAGALVLFIETEKADLERQFPPVDCTAMTGDTGSKSAVVLDEYYDWFDLPSGRTGRLECFCRELLDNVTFADIAALFNEPFPVPKNEKSAQEGQEEVFSNPIFFKVVADTSTDLNTDNSEYTVPDSAGWDNGDLPSGWVGDDLCAEWLNTFGQLQASFYGGALLVIVLNSSFPELVRRLVKSMRLPSTTSSLRYNTFFLWIAMLINTGLMAVIINARIDEPGIRDLAIGDEDDFDSSWFVSVGASLTLTMFFNVVLNQVTFIRLAAMRWYFQWADQSFSCSRNSDITAMITQDQLNDLWAGPEWPTPELYSSIMNVIFVCLMFSAGLPLMVPIAALYCIFFFWTQKYMFLRVFRRPPMFDQALAVMINSLLPWALVLHLLFGAWAFGNGAIFLTGGEVQDASITPQGTLAASTDSGSGGIEDVVVEGVGSGQSEASSALSQIQVSGYNVGSRLSHPAVLLMVIAGALLLAYLIIRSFFFEIFRTVLGVIARIICPCRGSPTGEDFEDLKNYFDALPDRVMNDFKHRRHLPKKEMWPQFQAALERRRAKTEDTEGTIEELHELAEVIGHAEIRRHELRNQIEMASVALHNARNAEAKAAATHGGNVPDEIMEAVTVWEGALIQQREELTMLEEDIRHVKARHRHVQQHVRAQRRLSHTEAMAEEIRLRNEERSKTIGSTVYSYDLEANPEYERKFGFNVIIHDRTLNKEVAKYMPHREGVEVRKSTKRLTSGFDLADVAAHREAVLRSVAEGGEAGREAIAAAAAAEAEGEEEEEGEVGGGAAAVSDLIITVEDPDTGPVDIEIPAEFAHDEEARDAFIQHYLEVHRAATTGEDAAGGEVA